MEKRNVWYKVVKEGCFSLVEVKKFKMKVMM